MPKQKDNTVALRISKTLAACIRREAKEEGSTAQEWLEAVVSIAILQGTTCRSVEEYIKEFKVEIPE